MNQAKRVCKNGNIQTEHVASFAFNYLLQCNVAAGKEYSLSSIC
jgi:hypothetical protein